VPLHLAVPDVPWEERELLNSGICRDCVLEIYRECGISD
jgi:hypothetical protein